eukprot:s369_g9.t1
MEELPKRTDDICRLCNIESQTGSIEDSIAWTTRNGEAVRLRRGRSSKVAGARPAKCWAGNKKAGARPAAADYKMARPCDCGEADGGKQAVARPGESAVGQKKAKSENQRQEDGEWRGRVSVARPIQAESGCGEAGPIQAESGCGEADKNLAQENTGHRQCGEAEKEVAAA